MIRTGPCLARTELPCARIGPKAHDVAICRRVRLIRLALVAVLVLAGVSVYGQDSPTAERDLFRETLELDIGTANYYELVAWCEQLDLPTRGSRAELQNRIRTYYKLTPPKTAESPEDGGRKNQPIEIERANSTQYFEDPESGERYMEAHGDVVVTMRDPDSDSVHTIHADRIVFNEAMNHLTASGSLEYTLEQGGKTEVFRGDSLSFSLDDWVGQFSRGTSTVERDFDEETITFFYSGETIYRLTDDIILLQNGTITSSNPDNPNYRIEADSISILAPQEWALENAILYVGHVPLLYFPFFFHPGDELFVHPAIGFLDVQGYYIQTTTYLIGQKQDSTGSLSFLRVSEESSGSYDTEIDGLFLRKKKKNETDAESAPASQNELKVIADVYGRHGMFLGVDTTLTGSGFFRSFDSFFGLARTRNIYIGDGGQYTYLARKEDGTGYESVWNPGYFLNARLPFRYGGTVALKTSTSWLNLDLALAAYSDPFMTRDFAVRSEEIDWAGLLGIDEATTTGGIGKGTRTDRYQWKLSSRFTPNVTKLSPYLQTAQINRFDALIDWRSGIRPAADFPDVSSFDPIGFVHPERYFFYPESMTLPSIAGRVAGTVFKQTLGGTSTGREPEKTTGDIPELRPPWESINTDDEDRDEETETPEYRIPKPIDSSAVSRINPPTLYDHQLAYSLSPDFTLDSRFASDTWTRPDDIILLGDADPIAYSLANLRGNMQLSYKGSLYRSTVTLNDSLNVQATLRNHFDQGANVTDTEWDRYELQDNTTSLFRLNNTINLVGKPLFMFDTLDASTVTYELGTTLFERVYDTTQGLHINTPGAWTDDLVGSHKLSGAIKFESAIGDQSLAIASFLPPKDPQIEFDGSFATWWFLTNLKFGFEENEEAGVTSWISRPVTLKERFTPDIEVIDGSFIESSISYDPEDQTFGNSTSKLTVKSLDGLLDFGQTFVYDVENAKASESTTSLTLDWFTAQFTAKEAIPYDFIVGTGWQASDTEAHFLPYNARFNAKYELEKQRLWRNRIELAGSVSSTWNLQLIKVTDSTLDFNTRVDLSIAEFLDLSFSTRSEQRSSYLYVPILAYKIPNADWVNPIVDIAKSFNFFNIDHRRNALFNLSSISVEATHYLGDWELNLNYTGKPVVSTVNSRPEYTWDSTLSILVRWYPIPEIKRNISYSGDELKL